MRILFIGRQFFGYESLISNHLRERGFQVDFVADVPFNSTMMKAITRIFWPFVRPYAERLMKKKIDATTQDSVYNCIFVIIGECLTVDLLRILKKRYPNAKFSLHLWDSIGNRRQRLVKNFQFFDRVSSFDPYDSKRYKIFFRPLFYSSETVFPNTNCRWDISFIGTDHSDRFRILSLIQTHIDKNMTFFCYLYSHAKWVHRTYRLFRPSYWIKSELNVKFTPLSKNDYNELIASSRCLIDLEHPAQKGLTIRTFEILAAGKKLITTNSEISSYDFYDSRRIHILDRDNPMIPKDFVFSDTVDRSLLSEKYSLKNWVDDVIVFPIVEN